jgi:hypothetical protein
MRHVQISYTRDLGISVWISSAIQYQTINLPPDGLYTTTLTASIPPPSIYSVGGFNAPSATFPCC